jgi:HAE1 family hydrophobic/amphiphilic exporter-1
MSLSKTAVSRPTTTLIIFVVLVALGFYASTDLPLALLPDMELPYVAISTSYPGAGPEEVEKRVSRPIESVVSGVSGIEQLFSDSSTGTSLVYIQFAFGTNMDEVMNDLRGYLDYVKDALPEEAKSPMIYKMDPNMIPIMHYAVSGNRTPEELRKYAEDLGPKLEQGDGVASAHVSGGRERAIRIDIPRDRLQAYNLTITQISQMLGAQNIQVAGGTLTENTLNYSISTVGEYGSLDDIRNTVISYKPTGSDSYGKPSSVATVRLRDIANVYDGYKDQTSLVYLNGIPCVELSIQKQSGSNSVKAARAVKAKMADILKEAPSDIKITLTEDTTDVIQRSVDEVTRSAIEGALFAILVLLVFLRNFRSTIIVGLAIPISLIATLGIMYFAGMSLNIMTLAGLALAVGKLVDDSIVVLENIYTYHEKGAKPVAASVLGTQEMMLAVTASTLTTCCVFLPLIMYKQKLGIVGEVFQGLAMTVIISLACSLIVAVVLVPVLTSKYIKIGNVQKKKTSGPFGPKSPLGAIDRKLGEFFDWLDDAYSRSIRVILRHKAITIGSIAALFVFSMAMIPQLGFIYMPTSAADSITVTATLPVGTSVETTENVLREFEQIVYKEVKGYKNVTVLAGTSSNYGLGGTTSYEGTLTISLPKLKDRIDSEDAIKSKLRKHFSEFPGASFQIGSNSSGISLGGGSSGLSIRVKSDDLGKARTTANAIKDILATKAADIVTDPASSLKDGLPRANIVIDREKLYGLGLNIYSVGQEIKANVEGTTASKFRKDGEETDIVIALAETDKTKLADLEQIFVTNSSGDRIPVSSFAHYEEGVSPISILREDQSRLITVTAGIKPGVSTGDMQKKVEKLVKAEVPDDPAVRIEYGGDYEDMMKAVKQFAIIILMAIILVFAVMASQFESLLDPFIVLFNIPLSMIGIVAIYAITGQPLNLFTAVGMLVLIGIIVNNGIVLIDYTNLLVKRGLPLKDACAEAGRSRLRPVVMTTLTTILGLVPMAFFPGEGSEMTQPIGQTVLGGLSFGTVMTLFLMPVLYYCFNRFREKREAKRAAREAMLEQDIEKTNFPGGEA